MKKEKEDNDAAIDETKPAPGLMRNYISLAGVALSLASLTSILLFIAIEMTSGSHGNPYLGILAYMIFPAFLILGLLLIPLGIFRERRRRRRLAPDEIAAYPAIDLNNPRHRRRLVGIVVGGLVFIALSLVGSYRAYEYTDSVAFCGQLCHEVMHPEFIAYQASPHARVRCVDCHVGPGADFYVRSKISGAYQLYAVTFKKYPKPIPTPVHNLRPAQETCEQCHWPEKFFGAQLKVFNRYGYDENNTVRTTRMLINTGGGSEAAGLVMGIHWHMNIANEITYISSDDQRQRIPWVQLKDRAGNVTEYTLAGEVPSAEEIAAAPKRRMDCVDCHNRPSHIYQPPDRAVNDAFLAGRLDPGLPYLKRQAVEVLSKPYQSTDEAINNIAASLDQFYRTNYPELHARKADAIKAATEEIQRIFRTYIFPEMKVDWQTHPDNVGHFYNQGCFRCHDGKHVSKTGAVIRSDCNICHTVLDQSQAGSPVAIEKGSFKHPVELGELAKLNCANCHRGSGGFTHPVDLGDISQFKCIDCHAAKNSLSLNRKD